jgi:outer membrane protein TolC
MKRQAVAEARGNLRSAKGRTDPTLGTTFSYNREDTPYAEENNLTSNYLGERVDTTSASLWLQKVFAFGLTVKPSISYTRTSDQYNSPETSWSEYPANAYGALGVELSLPLTKAFKDATVANTIESYSHLLAQSEADLKAQVSDVIMKTAQAYWSYLATYKKFHYYKEAEIRMSNLLNDIKTLVEANERPRSDLEQMQANLSTYQVNSIVIEQKMTAALNSLAVSMGTPFAEFAMLGIPADDFPEDILGAEPKLEKQKYIELALQGRPDLDALKQKAEALKIQTRIAEIDQRPDLDLKFSMGYRGLYYGDDYPESFTKSFTENNNEGDFGGSLVFSLGLPNNTKKGALEASQAQYNQVVLYAMNQEKIISANTALQTDLVGGYYKTMVSARVATGFYEKAVESEFKKMKAGLATVESLVSIQDRQMNAAIQYIDSVNQFLSAVVELKNATGTLVDLTEKDKDHLRTLYQLPDNQKAGE